jgi:pimeloyl-ACP methyl ester carboxylesterase
LFVPATGAWIDPQSGEPGKMPIAAWISRPETANGLGVVFLPAVGYAYSSSHRAVRVIAEALAEQGCWVVRVDYPGTGDSAGREADIEALSTWRDTVSVAATWVRQLGVAQVAIIGLDLGATLALMECSRVDAAAVIAIHPVWSGNRFVRRLRLLGLDVPADPLAIASGGSFFSAGLSHDIAALEIDSLDIVGRTPVLIVDSPGRPDSAHLVGGMSASTHVETWNVATLGGFLERPAEEAVADPELAGRLARWLSQFAPAMPAMPAKPVMPAMPAKPVMPAMPAKPVMPVPGYELVAAAEVAPSIVEEFVTIGPDELAGVLTRAEGRGAGLGRTLVLLNSGSDPHIGPGRAWVELARRLVDYGWSTLRVDWTGWGESPDGESAPGRPYDQHTREETRRLISALQHAGADTVVLGGLCAGAWVALDTARRSDEVDGVIALNPQLYWRRGDPVEALLVNTRLRRHDEIAWIKAEKASGRWDREDATGKLAIAGEWLEELTARGTPTSLLFAEGDDGLEYLEDRMSRRLGALLDVGVVRVREIPEIDHSMHQTWLRERLYATVAEELGTIRRREHATDSAG